MAKFDLKEHDRRMREILLGSQQPPKITLPSTLRESIRRRRPLQQLPKVPRI